MLWNTGCSFYCIGNLLRRTVSRILQSIPVLLAVFTLTFFMVRAAPGGPFGTERRMSEQQLERLNAHYGLDKSLGEQYLTTLSNIVLKADLGPSFRYEGQSVNGMIAGALPVSLELGLWAMLIAICTGIPLGVLAAVKRNTWLDIVPMGWSMIGICLPNFVIGPLLVMVFSIWLGWFNPTGWYSAADRVLPSLTLGLSYAAIVARLTRAGVVEVLAMDYIRAARAKGIDGIRLIFTHALRGGLLPVVAYLGPAFAGVLTGSFVVETIFNVPGLGQLFVRGALGLDFTMVQGTVLLYAAMVVLMNLIADLLQSWLNPQAA